MTDNFGILLYENAQPMDIIGPWEVLAFWQSILNAPINLYLISENDLYVSCANDIVMKAHAHFHNSPKLDYLIIPGGPGRLVQTDNEKLITYLKEQAKHCKYILSVCTGMFLLEKTGLLRGKSATTYWRALPELKSLPDVQVVEERLVKCGNIWTAGGVSSGIDLALALIEAIAGKEAAGQVQLLFEYFPKNTLYCAENTLHTLPAYSVSADNVNPYLPHYINEYIENCNRFIRPCH
jgi:transcriptional regulator GlxA family with amidase domain